MAILAYSVQCYHSNYAMKRSKGEETMCPVCNGNKSDWYCTDKGRLIYGVEVCRKCGAVYGTCYKGESYEIVLPYWDVEQSNVEQRYFDLVLLGSEGKERTHGWYNPKTKKITQVG